jgi:hypothetical protein
MRRIIGRTIWRIAIFAILFIFSGFSLLSSKAEATLFGTRSVMLSNYQPLATANYDFQFVIPSTSIIGSITFEFCTTSAVFSSPCDTPAGLDASSPTLTSETGNTGFGVDNIDSTANRLVLSRAPAAGSIINSTYDFTNIVNPSTPATTVYVRISTHASSDGTGSNVDTGAVAYFISSSLSVGAFVPPYLRLCVGLTVAPDCSSLSGDTVNLGIMSPSHSNAGQSQFAAGTNSPSGYNIYSLGTTMTSGNNSIASINSLSSAFPGTPQFGINLRANLNPAVGADPVGLGLATPTGGYDTPNKFKYIDGDAIATAAQPSDYNRMTVSYLVNIPGNQNVGVYSTTISYLIISQF